MLASVHLGNLVSISRDRAVSGTEDGPVSAFGVKKVENFIQQVSLETLCPNCSGLNAIIQQFKAQGKYRDDPPKNPLSSDIKT